MAYDETLAGRIRAAVTGLTGNVTERKMFGGLAFLLNGHMFAGVVGISPLRALVPSAAASAIWYAFLVAAGAALGLNLEAAKGLLSSANRILGLLSAVALMLAVAWLWRHNRRRGED